MQDFKIDFQNIQLAEHETVQVAVAMRKAALNELSNLDLMKNPNLKLQLDNMVNGMRINPVSD